MCYHKEMGLSNEQMLRSINDDRALGSAMLFAHRHKQHSPKFHIDIIDLWRSADEFVAVQAFRQGAKTTLSEEFLTLEAAFGNFKYCLIFGETYTKACERISGMKNEFVTNTALINLFGNMKGTVWSENRIILKNGTLIEAHGWEEEIRGYLHNQHRPDRAYLDDIENKENTRDTLAVDRNWKKLHLQLIPAMDKESRKIRMTGTPLADDCMIRRASASPNWVSAQFPLCDRDIDDPNAQSLWEERYPIEWIRNERDSFAREGMLREFNQEFMLIAEGSQGKPFTEDMLRFQDLPPASYTPRVVIIDPARTVEVKKSDQTGHVTVSRLGTTIYIHQSGGEYWQPDEIVAGVYNMSSAHDNADVVIEKNSLDDWLLQPIRAMSLMTGRHVNVRPVNAPQDRDKAQFIMGMRPFMKAGDIVMVGGRAKHQQLVTQMLNFPSGKRDILNALAYALRVFSGVPIYGDFSDANLIERYEAGRADSLLLGCNSSSTETAVVLCVYSGAFLTVVGDWLSPLVPNDCVPDIAKLIRSMYPGRKITAWVPADVFDQVGHNPLVAALRASNLPAKRAEHSSMARSSLSPMIRTTMRGRRVFQVDRNARGTMQALASGYNWPVKSGGERGAEPERGPARTLMEGLETLAYAIEKVDTSASVSANAYNSLGAPYLSALPGR